MPRFDAEKRCARCHAPQELCYCALLPCIETQTRVSIIIHRNEIHRATASANTAHLCLPNSRIFPYGLPGQQFDMDALLASAPAGSALCLFPESHAETLHAALIAGLTPPIHLIVPDGSWAQAKRIRRRLAKAPGLQSAEAVRAMRVVALPPVGNSRYQLRYSHEAHQLCTLEAIAWALGMLEGEGIGQSLLEALGIQVERMKGKRPRFTNPSANLKKRF
jgi:DTW domain-containing protein YfiP